MTKAHHSLAAVFVVATLLAGGSALASARQASPAASPGPVRVVVLPPDEPAYGATYGEWSARQWQWLLSFPTEVSPYEDETGERCGYGQAGPVFFLTGTAGPRDRPRACAIPAGVAILVPILAGECSTVEPPPAFGRDEAELVACAAALLDRPLRLGATLDGAAIPDLERYRVRSPRFTVALPPGNRLGVEPGVAAMVSDGYWLLLAPLPPGEHLLRVGVTLPESDQQGGATYRLTVAEPTTVGA